MMSQRERAPLPIAFLLSLLVHAAVAALIVLPALSLTRPSRGHAREIDLTLVDEPSRPGANAGSDRAAHAETAAAAPRTPGAAVVEPMPSVHDRPARPSPAAEDLPPGRAAPLEGPADASADLASLAPAHARAIGFLQTDLLRASPHAVGLRAAFRAWRDFDAVFGSSALDALTDFDDVLLASDNPFDPGATVAVARSGLPAERLRASVERVAGTAPPAATAPNPWHSLGAGAAARPAVLVDLGADYGNDPFAWCLVEPTLLLVGARPRVEFLLRGRPGRVAELAAQAAAQASFGADASLGATHSPTSGLAGPPALRVEAADLAVLAGQAGFRVVPALPSRVRLAAWIAADAAVVIQFEFATADAADAFELLLPRAIAWLRTDPWMARLGLSAIADRLQTIRAPESITVRAELDENTVRRVLLILPLLLAGS